jgi:hypothetical protein
MPPATESIMGSLPAAKAGVGSAVNDTTRQVGAALGVAVLGSIMSSTYTPRVSDAIAGAPLPPDAAQAIKDQIGAAMEIAHRIGGAPGRALANVAGTGFTDGMSDAFLVGAGALLVGAVLTLVLLPAHGRDHERYQDVPIGDDRSGPTGIDGSGPAAAPPVPPGGGGAGPAALAGTVGGRTVAAGGGEGGDPSDGEAEGATPAPGGDSIDDGASPGRVDLPAPADER